MAYRFLRLIAGGVGVFLLAGIGFYLYAYFLVDYSLENLENVLRSEVVLPPQSTYVMKRPQLRAMVMEDLAVEELAREDLDYKSLIFLEMAERAAKENQGKWDQERMKFYSQKVAQKREKERGVLLRILDSLNRTYRRIIETAISWFRYFYQRLFPQAEEPVEASSVLLLARAEEKLENWDLEGAAHLFSRYLELYPRRPDRGFVTLSLAHIFIKQRRFYQAERLLHNVRIAFIGSEEGIMASRLLKKIEEVKRRQAKIEKLEEMIPFHEKTPLGEKVRFQLAREYLYAYEWDRAQALLEDLCDSRQGAIRHKAKFYLGWLHKLHSKFGKSEEIFLDLLKEETLEPELALGLQFQLADIYYQKNEIDKALLHYQTLAEKAVQALELDEASREAWRALAEVEQAKIYFFRRDDAVKARWHLNRVGGVFARDPYFRNLERPLREDEATSFRDAAFRALRRGQVNVAWSLFQKHVRRHPDDAWAYSGMATVYVFLGDFRKAVEFAEKGYSLQEDEYTASVYGWIYGLLKRYDKAVPLFDAALQANPAYVPARYDLAWVYLQVQEDQRALDLLTSLEKDLALKEQIRARVLNNAGYALWNLGRHQEAVERFHEALRELPDYAEAKMNLERVSTMGETQFLNPGR